MSMDRATLKANARQQLGGGIFSNPWLTGLLICLIASAIPGAISGIISGISSGGAMTHFNDFINLDVTTQEEAIDFLFSFSRSLMPTYAIVMGGSLLISILITVPLTYGLKKSFLDLVMGRSELNIESLFSGFKSYGDIVSLGFMTWLLTFLWSLLFIIPGIIKSYAYSQAYYVKAEHPEYNWRQCLDESEEMMRGYKFSYFILQLSFIGWIIVGALACGVGTLWVSPYAECTYANFYAWRTAQNAQNIPEEIQ